MKIKCVRLIDDDLPLGLIVNTAVIPVLESRWKKKKVNQLTGSLILLK
ncbi:DUF2000 domain-containing protein [Oceanobacillus sp. FSL W8-0428]|uniref:Uncharacterized protein n=1 Tax=Oceanobacillus sojae TaxID=582851 RepID=A0A511ZHC5_9BACI|nr:DUF2000 domain-containing protein [Oceanobacillus sojae]GEN86847.1 hypothetical protein OSO01_15860 [Oceanobacillus sojae]